MFNCHGKHTISAADETDCSLPSLSAAVWLCSNELNYVVDVVVAQ